MWKRERRRMRQRLHMNGRDGIRTIPIAVGGIAAVAGLAAVAWRVTHSGDAAARA
jgi:hypothetical protein